MDIIISLTVRRERKNCFYQKIITCDKDLCAVTGLSIYVVASFFVFLFYVPMIKENPELANNMWDVNNVAYIILCIFITKAFYVPASN